MGHGHVKAEIRNPGNFEVSSGMRGVFWLFLTVGVVTFLLGIAQGNQKAVWVSFVHNHFYFMSLAIGGLFFAAIQWITGAMWSAPIRRVSESFSAYLPLALLTFLILCAGIPHLYEWSHPEKVHGDLLLEGKAGYLNVGFFITRNVIALLIWLFFSWKLIGNSTAQDKNGDLNYTLKNRFLSAPFLILFGLTFTMASFDILMSLDPHWFSTMFGVYCFSGLFYSTLALTCLLTLFLRSQGKLDGIVSLSHLHDLGKFMFAFTVFWAYIGFSQFMLIWYANLPEETGYFAHRMHEGWFGVSVFLLVGKFLTPFFLLISRHSKRNVMVLAISGSFMMLAQWIDVLWMVQPEFYSNGPQVGLFEIGVTLGFVGMFGLAVFRFLKCNNVVAIGDPRLAESVFHHHQ